MNEKKPKRIKKKHILPDTIKKYKAQDANYCCTFFVWSPRKSRFHVLHHATKRALPVITLKKTAQ